MSIYDNLRPLTVQVITRLKPHTVSLVGFTMRGPDGQQWRDPVSGRNEFAFKLNPRLARTDDVYSHVKMRFEVMVARAFNVPDFDQLNWDFMRCEPQRLVLPASPFYIERGYQRAVYRNTGTQWVTESSGIYYQPQLIEGPHVNWDGEYQYIQAPHLEGGVAWSKLEHHIWVNMPAHIQLIKGN